MALSISTVWEVRAGTGNDSWGGGFVAGSGGTDRSQQNAAQVTLGAGVTSSITTTVVTFTGGTYTVLAGDVGNLVQFISGTNVTAGFYQITAVSAGLNGTWTLDRTPLTTGTTTNAVANMGGALATLSKLSGAMVASNKAYLKGTFTSLATNTFAQTVATPSAAAPYTRLIGYGTTRGDTGHATLTLTTNIGLTGISATGAGFGIEQVDVDCGSLGTSTAINMGASSFNYVTRCKVANFTTLGLTGTGTDLQISYCEATGGGAAATAAINGAGNPTFVENCHVHDNACAGIISPEGSVAFCLVVNNSGAASIGISTSWGSRVMHNTCENNGGDGLRLTSDIRLPSMILNNLITNNGGFGLNNTGSALPAREIYDGNAYWNNTSGARNNLDSVAGIFGVAPYTNVRDVTLSGSPYVGPTTGTTANFALNDTAGAGQACKTGGTVKSWPGNTGTTSYPIMGAVQGIPGGGSAFVMSVG